MVEEKRQKIKSMFFRKKKILLVKNWQSNNKNHVVQKYSNFQNYQNNMLLMIKVKMKLIKVKMKLIKVKMMSVKRWIKVTIVTRMINMKWQMMDFIHHVAMRWILPKTPHSSLSLMQAQVAKVIFY